MKLAHQLVGLLVLSLPGIAQRTEDDQVLPPDVPQAGQAFYAVGSAVARDGEWTAVSAVWDFQLGPGQKESVVLLYRDVGRGHELFQTIRGLEDPGYGYYLAMDGNTLVLGSWRWGWPRKGMGRVFIFEWDGVSWNRTQVIRADGLAESVYPDFGSSVDISGDVLVVGARGVDRPFENAGEARIYERHSGVWELAKRIRARPGTRALQHESWGFGYRVAADGDTVAVSAPFGNDGTVVVYVRAGHEWETSQRIEAPDGLGGRTFGTSMALAGETLVVGEPMRSGTPRPGKAHIYTRDGSGEWLLEQSIQASDGYATIDHGDEFGFSVAVHEDLIVVGAQYGRPYGWNTGAGYLFRRTSAGWPATEDEQLAASDPPVWDVLGCSVAIAGNAIVLGASQGMTNGGATGKAYIFHR